MTNIYDLCSQSSARNNGVSMHASEGAKLARKEELPRSAITSFMVATMLLPRENSAGIAHG